MQKNDIINKIRQYFGLNIYETKVWLALLNKGIASAGEVAEISGVPRSRTYDVLEGLEKQGYAIEKIGKPTKYIAVKPNFVIEKLKKKAVMGADEKIKVLDNLKGTKEYEELESIHTSSVSQIKREDISGAIKGKSTIMSHAREILENAEKEIIICMPAQEFLDRSRLFSGLFERLKSNKISVRLALSGADEDLKKIADRYNVKPVKTELKSKFFIIDRKQVLFSLTDTNTDDEEIAIWLNSDFFASAFASLFDLTLK